MSLRELAIILVIAIAVPALLLIRLVPMFKVEKTDAASVARAFGRSQVWFYGGAGLALSIILLLKFFSAHGGQRPNSALERTTDTPSVWRRSNDCSAMHVDDVLDDRQPQTDASLGSVEQRRWPDL